MIPSMTNGQRMNQLVAPTSFMTSTSRRRAKIDSRIVLPISRIEATIRIEISAEPRPLDELGHGQQLVGGLLAVGDAQLVVDRRAVADLVDDRLGLGRVGSA